MKRKPFLSVFIVVIVLLITVIGCGPAETPDTQSQAADNDDTVDTDEVVSPVAEDGVVEIGMFTGGGRNYNDPVGIHVQPGTTIRFINRSGMHSTTAYHGDNGRENRIPDGADAWDSGLMTRRDATFEVTLEVEGVYDYFCIPHETTGHVGRIVVGDPAAFPARPTDGLPQAAAAALPATEGIVAEEIIRP